MKLQTRNHSWSQTSDGMYRLTWEHRSSTGWNPQARTVTSENAAQWCRRHGIAFYGPTLTLGADETASKIRRVGVRT